MASLSQRKSRRGPSKKRSKGKKTEANIRVEARQAADDGRVKKYVFEPSGRVLWVVVGRNRDYLVLPLAKYCACDDFFYRVLGQERKRCYHLLAVALAQRQGSYEEIEERDDLYLKFISEWRS